MNGTTLILVSFPTRRSSDLENCCTQQTKQRGALRRFFRMSPLWESNPTVELTRRRESKHPAPHQASCETRSRRSRPTICWATPLLSGTNIKHLHRNTKCLRESRVAVALQRSKTVARTLHLGKPEPVCARHVNEQ